MKHTIVVHPRGLDPFQAAKVWQLRKVMGLPWAKIQTMLLTVDGGRPSLKGMRAAVRRIDAQRYTPTFRRTGTASLAYGNCGRKPSLAANQKAAVIEFVKRWRHKRFCTAAYIIQELRLPCGKRTVHRVLNAGGYHWRPVSKRSRRGIAPRSKTQGFVAEPGGTGAEP